MGYFEYSKPYPIKGFHCGSSNGTYQNEAFHWGSASGTYQLEYFFFSGVQPVGVVQRDSSTGQGLIRSSLIIYSL